MRYPLIDEIRGLTLLSMLLYHACWDLVYIFGLNAPWYKSQGAYYWQQSICWTFILLSGFCWHFARDKVRHGLKIFLGGAVITVVTLIFLPEDRVVFGILTFLGSAALMMIIFDKGLKHVPPLVGVAISMVAFALTKQVNHGFLGFATIKIMALPSFLYKNLFTTFLGFRQPGFFSTDYFSIIPWIFLYIAGYYAFIWMKSNDRLYVFENSVCPPLGVMGRHSFLIYMVHQPVLYVLLGLFMYLMGGLTHTLMSI